MASRLIPGSVVLALVLVVALGAAPASEDALAERARLILRPLPPALPAVEGNALTPEKIELGRMLFFDPRLSASGLISCNTCHNLGVGGADLQETSIGHAWQKGPRNAPTVLNAVFNVSQFWDGRARDLAEQAKGPVQAAVEMANTPARVVETVASMPGYVALFRQAFPGDLDPVSFDNVARAIEAFEATLVTPNAPLDAYLAGDEGALGEEQKAGLRVFLDRGCGGCHKGVNVGGEGYFPFGVVKRPVSEILPAGDKGRLAVTKAPSDEFVFRVPSLRNVALTAPYFHSGKVWDLGEAVSVMGASQLGTELPAGETASIVAFLSALTGDQPRVEYPILPVSTSRTPKPVLERASGR